MSRRQLQFLLIFAAFALPTLLALLLQTPWLHWEPEATRNRGELISPVQPMSFAGTVDASLADGRRWTLLLRLPVDCDPGCQQRILLLSRVREAQGRNMDRVQMLASAAAPPAGFDPWPSSAGDAEALLDRLQVATGGVLMIDPLGNAMMRYRADADPSDLRKDLAHLLRWSKLGQ